MFVHYNETFDHLKRFLVDKYGSEPLGTCSVLPASFKQSSGAKGNNYQDKKGKSKPSQNNRQTDWDKWDSNDQSYNSGKDYNSKISYGSIQQGKNEVDRRNNKGPRPSETTPVPPKSVKQPIEQYERVSPSQAKPVVVDPKYSLTHVEPKKLESQPELKSDDKKDKKQAETAKTGEQGNLTTARGHVQKELVFERFGVFVASVRNPALADSKQAKGRLQLKQKKKSRRFAWS